MVDIKKIQKRWLSEAEVVSQKDITNVGEIADLVQAALQKGGLVTQFRGDSQLEFKLEGQNAKVIISFDIK